VRAGDIQVGTAALLEDVFPEPRFCSWTIGEVHIQDSRIVPNGRRDGFEQNIHFANLRNHLAPIARGIAKRCRTNSSLRQRRRTFDSQASLAEQKLDILEQQVLAVAAQANLLREAESHVAQLDKIVQNTSFVDQLSLQNQVTNFQSRLAAMSNYERRGQLGQLPGERGDGVREVIGLIYECAPDLKSAKALVEKILNRLN
jgi:molecular chaperone HtpG